MQRIPVSLLANPVHCLALGFGSGYVPKAPGTAGTLVGVALYLLLMDLPWQYYLVVVAGCCLAGVWLCGYTARVLGAPDHPAIVWDEISGYLLTMALAPDGWLWIVLGFILFRLFDIFKPWPIVLLDKRVKGGLGVMVDDLVAGIFSLTVLQVIAYIL
jgi:phosphatidylglycerophosphatase A